MRTNNKGLKTFPPVSRWELIDAISKLHVINDCPSQLTIAIDNSSNPCCNQLTKGSLNDCQCSDCSFLPDLTKFTKRQVMDDNKQ
ncbi:hypothetical protein [Aliterella atlantica]|uniref:hypothetical protein n=1 Tax=Aliterella atlantica TaxID=1827278 RepID=UPI001186EB0A|nr:hypothetical protein [Aliterella atlantica]